MDDGEVPPEQIELIGDLRARKTGFALLFEPTVQEYEVQLDDNAHGSASEFIGPAVRPQDVATMTLSQAIYWIACKGNTADFERGDREVWKAATEELMGNVTGNSLAVSGRRSHSSLAETVPNETFRGVAKAYPCQSDGVFSETIMSDEPVLELHDPSVDNEIGDRVFSGDGKLAWFDLRVTGADVAQFWPFQEVPPVHPSKPSESAGADPRAGASETDLQIFRASDGLWTSGVPAIKWVDFKRSVENRIKESSGTAPSDSSFKRFKSRWWELVLKRAA